MIIALQTLVFFRESLLTALDRLIRPYYKQLSLAFSRNGNIAEDEDVDDQVYSEFDEQKGVIFYPPMYAQRYAAVSDCLMDDRWCGTLEKVVDFGYHDMSFIKYLKEVPGIRCIMGVDIESIPLRCSSDLLGCEEYAPKRENPLQVTLFQGNAADPDYRLIGCDAVITIEMIEHMLPHDLDRLVHTVFGFIKPRIAVFTTPNADFNELFKALEKNGLRRWDHMFEWTREQFHDWCSNIVVRYPQFTVTCQGVGPGPPGTLHYGCCSQLALFVNQDYHKQQDLNLNSLALVANAPTPHNYSEVFEGWDSPINGHIETETFCNQPKGDASYTELLYPEKQSHMTLVISSTVCPSIPSYVPSDNFQLRDKTLQCNMDVEKARSFMMFDDEQFCNIVIPRRRVSLRVYEIGDVYSRLNCSTLQVKRFSKTTQNLMARNKIDSLVHTREVVDEIRHLTKTLNFNREPIQHQKEDGDHIWCNINWGDNAPYWNQYYKVVREYNYPFETKSEEVRILDLVSDEINRLIDMQYDEEFSVNVNRLEIPLSHLMNVVEHITDDWDRVRDLLIWNGYEIVDDVVIHSRLVVDAISVATHDQTEHEEDWQDNDTVTETDWDATEIHSTTSDASTIVPDFHGRCLRRALDGKVRNLKTMLTADEDITTELDRVVCKLMKLALRTSKGRQAPPPTRWMECKLLDLLTLTEKAIGRRKKQSIESYAVKAIDFDGVEKKTPDLGIVREQDNRVKEIVDKYRHLIQSTDNTDENNTPYAELDIIEDDFLSPSSNDFMKEFEYTKGISPSLVIPQPVFSSERFVPEEPAPKETPLERTKAWLNEDVEVVAYPNVEMSYGNISSATDHTVSTVSQKPTKTTKNQKGDCNKGPQKTEVPEIKTSENKVTYKKTKGNRDGKRKKSSYTKICKKLSKKKVCYNTLSKNLANEYDSLVNLQKKEFQSVNVATSKPIPNDLMELCNPELKSNKVYKEHASRETVDDVKSGLLPQQSISATEESFFIDIVMQDFEETIAMRRTIGTGVGGNTNKDKDTLDTLSMELDANLFAKHEVSTENVQSQTIFLNDINEPSTSKGIRHNISADVQCGPDTLAAYPMLSVSTSLVWQPQTCTTGVKINDAVTDDNTKGTDFGTSTDNNASTIITPRLRSVGIKIKDSDVTIACNKSECGTMTTADSAAQLSRTEIESHFTRSTSTVAYPETRVKLIKPISSTIEDSGSEFCAPSIGSSTKTVSYLTNISQTSNDIMLGSPEFKGSELSMSKHTTLVRSKLCCGGVHVHSYRDKQVCEDIVYQGEWQKYKPKAVVRKKPHTTNHVNVAKRVNEMRKKKEIIREIKVKSKEKVVVKKQEVREVRAESKKCVQMRNAKYFKIKHESITNENSVMKAKKPCGLNDAIIETPPNIVRPIPRQMKTKVTKVSSKIAMSSVASKNVKSAYTVKRPTILPNLVVNKKDTEKPHKMKKSNIPLYLKKRREASLESDTSSLDKSIESNDVKVAQDINKLSPLLGPKTAEINKDLLKFSDDARENISYAVFRNDLEGTAPSSDEPSSGNTSQESRSKRSHSPQSLHSSTCSSPNSIATVRAVPGRTKNPSIRRHATSSHKGSINTSESDNTTPTKNKPKITKRCKSARKHDTKDAENKENIPESTTNFVNKEKSPFIRPKSVCIARVKTESSSGNTLSRQGKLQISNKSIKIRTPQDADDKQKAVSPTISKKRSMKSDTSSNYSEQESNASSDSTNMVLVLEQQPTHEKLTGLGNVSHFSIAEPALKTDNNVVAEWVKNSNHLTHSSSVFLSMRQLLEETLDWIDRPHMCPSDSKTITLDKDNEVQDAKPNANVDKVEQQAVDTVSKTIVRKKDNADLSFLETDLENTLNRTYDSMLGEESVVSLNDTRLTVTDLDGLSYKSITSVSKYSEYYLADNEFNSTQSTGQLGNTKSLVNPANTSSVRDIFERREPHLVQNAPGALAVQAFSGFSLNADVGGDQPDPVALIDSETGSLALEVTRQATSEELFVSGRSSSSYESCLIDEDAVVPNWLFQIISQQHSVDEEPEPIRLGPVAAPLPEPVYDANGNVIEPNLTVVGAGAGDGRGIHSDHSQDSSGRGTSLSSSDSSTGPQSEVSAILIDPSAFTAQYEMMREPPILGTSSDVSPSHTYRIDDETGTILDTHAVRSRTLNGASDMDADISSIDTDVPDSSDN